MRIRVGFRGIFPLRRCRLQRTLFGVDTQRVILASNVIFQVEFVVIVQCQCDVATLVEGVNNPTGVHKTKRKILR